MRSDWPRLQMAKWCRTSETERLLFFEVTREAQRLRRTCGAQPAGIGAAQFLDYARHRSRGGFARGDAFARHWITAAGLETAEKLRIIRYRGGNLAARPAF